MRAIKHWILVAALITVPTAALAQEDGDSSSLFWDVTKGVVFDPTTYAPAALAYSSMKLDWQSSQPLFRNGWMEQNYRFTISGRPNDRPIGFAEGNRRIRNMALLHLQESIINNVAANLFERVLAEKYPQHRTLFKVLSWAERIAFASFVSYAASANHFRQAERNRQMALEYGYR
jgi:hypothetical protein